MCQDPARRGGVRFCARCTRGFCINPVIFETRSSNCTIVLLPEAVGAKWQVSLQRARRCLEAPERVFWILLRLTWQQALLGAFYAINDTDSSEYKTAAWSARSTASSASGECPILFLISIFGITAIFPVALRSLVTYGRTSLICA